MASQQDNISMALFCDFENVALGVRDANYDKFDIKRVLERLLLKGSIVVKKSYCDWERYKAFKAPMHEANFELIEIPHVRQSGKNSADIRLVVDALDLCYTKSHVNTFVIISGDSDFSPLVSKLRENAKHVIGVGVKNSTSDLLIANCDEFIFYDDLVRESQRNAARRDPREAQPQQRRSPEEESRRREEMDRRRTKIVELAAETYDALVTDRDDGGKIWASVLKEALKRRNPGFSEGYYGFKTFGNLLEEAQARGLLEFGRDEKSGAYVFRGSGMSTVATPAPQADAAPHRQPARGPQADTASRHDFHPPHVASADEPARDATRDAAPSLDEGSQRSEGRRGNRGGRGGRQSSSRNQGRPNAQAAADHAQDATPMVMAPAPVVDAAPAPMASQASTMQQQDAAPAPRSESRRARSSSRREPRQPRDTGMSQSAAAPSPEVAPPPTVQHVQPPATDESSAPKRKAPARQTKAAQASSSTGDEGTAPAPRSRRPAKKAAAKADHG